MSYPFLPSSFDLDKAHPTGRFQTLDVKLNTRPACPTCGPHQRIHSRGRFSDGPLSIFDLPRIAPVELRVDRRRYECAVCKGRPDAKQKTFSERGPHTHTRYDVTTRLYRYLLSAVARKPLDELHASTGVPAATLWDIATTLSRRLDANHRFATPAVLAMDGIKIRGHEYMVIADGVTGLPIGFLDSTRAADVANWVEDRLDSAKVRVFVADLHRTNTSVARIKFPNAIYVADKWHVVRRFQAVLSQVINKEIDDLRKSGKPDQASTIYDFKPGLMAVNKRLRRTRRTTKGGQRTLSFMDDLRPIVASQPRIRRAFWARHDLIRFYQSPTLAAATPWFERFHRHADPFRNLESMQEFDNHLTANWTMITNYFQTVTQRAPGVWRGNTTNNLERHNAEIRKRLRVRHGVQNLDLLRLISVYGARNIGSEIMLCRHEDCEAVGGPFHGPPVPPEIREATGIYWGCPAHH